MQLDLAIRRTPKPPRLIRGQRWVDARGRVFAWSSGSPERGRLEVAGTGIFGFSRSSTRVLAVVPPEADAARVEGSFRDIATPLALQTRGWQALHASAVSTPLGVVCLCGRSGAGKSTLAAGWIARGAKPWADDTVVFRTRASEPQTVRLEAVASDSRSLRAGTHRRIRALVVVEPTLEDDRPDVVEPLEPAQALEALLPHALCLDPSSAGLLGGLFDAYAELVRVVPTHRLRYRQDRTGIPKRVHRIEQLVESQPFIPGEPGRGH